MAGSLIVNDETDKHAGLRVVGRLQMAIAVPAMSNRTQLRMMPLRHVIGAHALPASLNIKASCALQIHPSG